MNIVRKIDSLCQKRGWSNYQLAEKSGIPQTTISSWSSKNAIPSLTSLEKICAVFGITMTQLFLQEEENVVTLTPEQKELLDRWESLDNDKKEVLLQLMSRI